MSEKPRDIVARPRGRHAEPAELVRKFELIDEAVMQFKRGEIQSVLLILTDSGIISVKRMPRVIED